MAWAPASTCPRLLSSTCRRLCGLVAGEPTPANADRTTAIKRDRSRCRLLTKRSFVDRCVGDTTAWRKVLCHGEYRCRGARGRAKATSWNAGGFGGYSNGRGGSARFPRRLDAGHRCAPLGGGPAVHSGGRTLPSTVANTLPRRNRNRQAGRIMSLSFRPRTLSHPSGKCAACNLSGGADLRISGDTGRRLWIGCRT
jgi:hypothetical protein